MRVGNVDVERLGTFTGFYKRRIQLILNAAGNSPLNEYYSFDCICRAKSILLVLRVETLIMQ